MEDTYGGSGRGPQPADGPRKGQAVSGHGAAPASSLEWEAELPLYRSGVVVRQLLLALGIPLLILAALLLALDPAGWRSIGAVVATVGAILLVLAILSVLLIYGGRYRYRIRLDDAGVEARPAGGTARRNAVVNALLVLSGRPTPMGTGLLAQSRQRERVAWGEVDEVVPEPRSRSVILRRGNRPLMVVACTEDNYEEVLQRARSLAGHGPDRCDGA